MPDASLIDTGQLTPSPKDGGISRIAIQRISLRNFRNYGSLSLEVGGQSVILTGHNGAGKTNLLEAISFLMPGRGMRRARIGDLDRRAEGGVFPWAVSVVAGTPGGEIQVGTGRDMEAMGETDKRTVRIDGRPSKGQSELSELFSVLWLIPQMDQLFMEGQGARRRFLDRLVYGFDGEHATRVNGYEYAMRERNRILTSGSHDPHWLGPLEEKMAATATAIAAARLETVAHINEVMRQSSLSFPKAELAISGLVEDALAAGEKALEAEQKLANALAKNRIEDARSGRTSTGTHRSELSVTHLEKKTEAAFCSTGEQKALLLSMLLAEARAGAMWHKRIPILLLDEVVAHLDPEKRAELFEEIDALGAQVWMTGTDVDFFHGMRDKALVFRVELGGINPL